MAILVSSVLSHLTLILSDGAAVNFHLDPLTPDPSHSLTLCLVSCLKTIRDGYKSGALKDLDRISPRVSLRIPLNPKDIRESQRIGFVVPLAHS